MPKWLTDVLAEREFAAPLPDTIPEGMRDHTLTSFAGSMRARGADSETILAALRVFNERRCRPPMEDFDLRRIANSARNWEPNEARPPMRTDKGNGERLVRTYGAELRFAHQLGAWLYWNGRYWQRDATAEIMRRAKLVASAIADEAKDVEDEDERTAILKWSVTSQAKAKLEAMISLAESEADVSITAEALDRQPWKLNALNGTIDLKTGELHPAKRSDLLTRAVPTVFDAHARCPQWEGFLRRIFDDQKSMIDFVQRIVGYTLTGSIKEHKLFFLYGTGANGKSTFIETIRAVLGEYAQVADFTTFLHRDMDSGGPRNDLARMPGARMVTASEVESGRHLNEPLIKNLTGGDKATARFLHHEFFDFYPEFKLWLIGNHKPHVRGTDEGFWRRIVFITFGVTIPLEERDGDLKAKLVDELPGILRWAVDGCLAWQKQGLDEPLEVTIATESYRTEMDSLQTFIAERCKIDKAVKVMAGDLYREYSEWCEATGERPLSQKMFAIRIGEKHVERKRTEQGMFYMGIDLQRSAGKVTGGNERPKF
jgi:putative DNA primase/helicase